MFGKGGEGVFDLFNFCSCSLDYIVFVMCWGILRLEATAGV